MSESYDVAIIGGGITGTALAAVLSRHSRAKSLILIERQKDVALVNSHTVNNAQTQHAGDIETNYGLEKALRVKWGADLQVSYLEKHAPHAMMPLQKMAIGVGPEECAALERRHAEFLPHYPHLRLLDRDAIAEVEPNVVEGRPPDERIVALYSPKGYAVDYRKLAESYLAHAKGGNARVEAVFDTAVHGIERRGDGFVLKGDGGECRARNVVVSAGSPSLLFAHAMGCGKAYAILPVAGSFYTTRRSLNGKVYTVQNPKIPLAAVHGDPAVYNRAVTRFGPTAMLLPFLERGHYRTFWEFLRTGTASPKGLRAALGVFWDRDILKFAFKNAIYELPILGKRAFLRSARKIIPTLRASDLSLERGAGGVRGQLVDLERREMAKGSDTIVGDGIIFNMAPSPGASFSRAKAVEDARLLAKFRGEPDFFDEEGMMREAFGAIREVVKGGAA